MKNADLQQRRIDATPRGVAVMTSAFVHRAKNATLWDVEDREYIDFAAGIGVLNTGHGHTRVVNAIQAQLERFIHTCYFVAPYESAVTLAERINEVAPIDGPAKTMFFTTGAEAVENAVKIARAHTGRSAVIAFGGAFHGRTFMGMSLTGKVANYKVGFGPFMPDVYHVPFPSKLDGVSVEASLEAIAQLFKCDVEAKRVAAIIIEPVQGEGGFNVAPPALMQGLRTICDSNGILLIADEIQSGFGRTGRLFAMDHHDVKPDLVTMAKSLAAGLPLSAVCGKAAIMDAPAPGGLGGTYAANPLAVAAAHAVLDIMVDEKLSERADRLGSELREKLTQLKARHPEIAEVRGVGSMNAIEFRDPSTGAPLTTRLQEVQRRAFEKGLLLISCGTHANAIRFLYPLTIPDEQFRQALSILEEALKD